MSLADYRRRTQDLYRAYRGEPDHERAVAGWRQGRDRLLRHHPDGPLIGRGAVPYAPFDPAARHTLVLDTDVEAQHLDAATATDGVIGMDRLGVLRLPGVGSLDVWWLAQYGGGLFVPLRDATAGADGGCYGGGRYLLDTTKGADLGTGRGGDGRWTVTVDLNLAYHPSCAYDPAWSCPLAPTGNTVAAAVTAGELLPPGGWY